VFALVQTDEPAEDVDLRKLMRDDDV
jgi:hypothetical protein